MVFKRKLPIPKEIKVIKTDTVYLPSIDKEDSIKALLPEVEKPEVAEEEKPKPIKKPTTRKKFNLPPLSLLNKEPTADIAPHANGIYIKPFFLLFAKILIISIL